MTLGLRNKNINYEEGWFFVTFQVSQNKSLLGAIVGSECCLNELGRAVEENIKKLHAIHNNIFIDKYVVMPNHIHMIVRLSGGRAPDPRYKIVSQSPNIDEQKLIFPSNIVGLRLRPQALLCPQALLRPQALPRPQAKGLSRIIGSFKSYTSNIYLKMKKEGGCPDIGAKLWQNSYYDVLISEHSQLQNIRSYIENNPKNWEQDRFGPVTEYSLGNIELLNEPLTAFVASEGLGIGEMLCIKKNEKSDSPQKSNPIISTFSSYEERKVLNKCLKNKRLFVKVCPGGIPSNIDRNIKQAILENRALLISPISREMSINKQRANVCNQYVLKNAVEIWTGHIRPGGGLEAILMSLNLSTSYT